jgi:hypothetical protein
VLTEGSEGSPDHCRGIYRLEVANRSDISFEDESARSMNDCEAILTATLEPYNRLQIVGVRFPCFDPNSNFGKTKYRSCVAM